MEGPVGSPSSPSPPSSSNAPPPPTATTLIDPSSSLLSTATTSTASAARRRGPTTTSLFRASPSAVTWSTTAAARASRLSLSSSSNMTNSKSNNIKSNSNRSLFNNREGRSSSSSSSSSFRANRQWWKQRQTVYLYHRIIVSVGIGLCVVCSFVLFHVSTTHTGINDSLAHINTDLQPPKTKTKRLGRERSTATATATTTTHDVNDNAYANAKTPRALFLDEWYRWNGPLSAPHDSLWSHFEFALFAPPMDTNININVNTNVNTNVNNTTMESCRWLPRRTPAENRRIQALCANPMQSLLLHNALATHSRRFQPCPILTQSSTDDSLIVPHNQSVLLNATNLSSRLTCYSNRIEPTTTKTGVSSSASPVTLFASVPTEANALAAGIPPIALSFDTSKFTTRGKSFPGCNVPCTSYGEPSTACRRFVERMDHGTPWIIQFSMEGEQYYPELHREPWAWKDNHFWSTTSYQSEIPLPYYSQAEYAIQQPPVDYTKAIHGAVFLARNCNSLNNREQIVRELLKSTVRVDSLSACLHNAEPPPGVDTGNKKQVMQHYLFYLAFENQCTADYITEKLWGPLEAGTVPIYFGAPNVHDHVPTNSIINVKDFDTTADLVAHLHRVMNNQTLYESYHTWRSQPLPHQFQKMYNITQTHSTCRTCRWAYARQYGVGWNHTTQELQPLVAGERTVCLSQASPSSNDLIRHPFQEVWTSVPVAREISIQPTHTNSSTPEMSPSDVSVTGSCRHLTNANRAVLIDKGTLRRTVRYQDGVVDLLIERIAPTTSVDTVVLQLHTMVQSSTIQRVRKGAWRLQDARARYTLLSLPLTDSLEVVSTGVVGVIQVSFGVLTFLPLRLRVLVEDVDTFHQDADKEDNFFGKLLTADFYSPMELFVQVD